MHDPNSSIDVLNLVFKHLFHCGIAATIAKLASFCLIHKQNGKELLR